MSDYADQAQDSIGLIEMAAIQAIRHQVNTPGSEDCDICGELIPEERRRAVPWAKNCTTCQAIIEHRKRVGQF